MVTQYVEIMKQTTNVWSCLHVNKDKSHNIELLMPLAFPTLQVDLWPTALNAKLLDVFEIIVGHFYPLAIVYIR